MKNFISTFVKVAVMVVTTAFISYSCRNGGDEEYTFDFTSPAMFFNFGETQTATFRTSGNVGSLTVSSTPDGWQAELNTTANTLKITAPDSLDETVDEDGGSVTPAENGTIVIRGYVGEKSVSASVFVSLGDVVDMAGRHANSYILSAPLTAYRISAVRPDGSAVEGIASVDIAWQSERYLIRYPEYKNGKITFTTYDDDGKLLEGNALLAAYDANGNILWSWHLWVTGCNPEENAVELNGYTFMGCNLGAFGNSTASDDEILASYGLYYQWGRPSPFPRPLYYNCAGSSSESLLDADMLSAAMTVEEADGTNNTMSAAIANPLVFITGLTAPWSGAGEPWSESKKTNYDPCPAGWRVPAAGAFEGLAIVSEELAAELESLRKAYGWTLTDGDKSAFFFAGGRRTYTDGSVINMNTAETPQPWEGFYWTSTPTASQSKAAGLYFDLDTDDVRASSLAAGRELQLSNGLQIRCVRE